MTHKPYLLGVTGSVGMGKSTTARMFADEGCPVWDADAAVHEIYQPGGPGSEALRSVALDAVSDLCVDRSVLKRLIAQDAGLLGRIEQVVHPLVGEHRQAFVVENAGSDVLVFDIPLLFETGAEAWLDAVVTVTAPPEVQRDRVMARPGMTDAIFESILARQMPDAEKRDRADFVVSTANGLQDVRDRVGVILSQIREARGNA